LFGKKDLGQVLRDCKQEFFKPKFWHIFRAFFTKKISEIDIKILVLSQIFLIKKTQKKAVLFDELSFETKLF
jgi:hypothetical protein